MNNVLMFVDSGVDDSLALMYALEHPQINVAGVVSGYGNITKEQSINNTAYLLKLAGREDIPIIAGVSGPLSGEAAVFYPEIHGEEGLGPIQPPEGFGGMDVYDIDKIIEIVNQYKNDLVIVGLGRQTDVALPLIIYGKNAYKDVKALYLMGGAFLVPGNVTAEAEANFYADPIAADLVLEKAQNIYLFPLNVTNKAILRPETINFVAGNTQSPFKNLIKPAYDYYYEAYKKLVPGIQGAPLHDVLVLSVLANPDMVKYISRRVRIERFGKAKGKSLADFRPQPEKEPLETLDNIAIELDVERFVIDFMEVFLSRSNTE